MVNVQNKEFSSGKNNTVKLSNSPRNPNALLPLPYVTMSLNVNVKIIDTSVLKCF